MKISNSCTVARLLISAVTSLALFSCGGGGGDQVAGGINGSGFDGGAGGGAITDFGSVIFSDSTFDTTVNTVFTIDDMPVVESSLRVGMIATFEIADDANSLLTTGTARRIDASTAIKGIVTSVSPLEVLGQSIVFTGDTLIDGFSGNANNIQVSDLVEVYGFTGSDNILQATRIENKTGSGLIEWKLTGVTSAVSATTLNIGNQLVSLSGAVIDNCQGGLIDGVFVEIKSDPNLGFSNGSTLNMVTKVECLTNGIPIPQNPSSPVIPAEFEGVVSGFNGGAVSQFSLGNQLVQIDLATEYRGGSFDDLVNGTRVEAEGSFDTVTGVLVAREIKFKQTRVRIEAPVNSADITLGVSLNIMGLTVFGTAATEDDDNILSAASGLPLQVEVRGFVDSNGDIFAEEIRERGNVDSNDVRLRGPIDNLINPNLTILSVPVNLSGAGAGYFDIQGLPLADINALFALLATGDILEVEDAQLIAGPAIDMDANSTVQLED